METPKRLQAGTEPKSPFSSKVILVSIGPTKIIFNIHRQKLNKTCFFDLHGRPPSLTEKLEREKQRAPTPAEETDAAIKPEVGDTATGEAWVDDSEEPPDYYICDRFHTPEAFKILVQWLYNEPPAPIRFRAQFQILLQTYVLACQYRAYPLQNRILDCFREYHGHTNVRLDDLIWMTNRLGDYVNSPLTDYLVEQVAYEITHEGIEEFTKENRFMNSFLEEGNRMIRRFLFNAIVRHAQASGGRLGDPAHGARDWHVEETGARAGELRHADRMVGTERVISGDSVIEIL